MRTTRRLLKIVLWTLGSLIALLFIGILLVTTVFKKDVKEAIEAQIEAQVNADIYIHEDDFSLSIFKNFPDVTARLKNFGVIGKDEFEGDTLMKMDEFAITIDLWSLFGDAYKVEGILLDKPVIMAKVNSAGKANWDIYIPSDEQEEPETPEDEEVKPLVLKVKEWEIREGVVIYDDKPGDLYAEIRGLNHTGSALIAEKYDLVTSTSMAEITVEMDGLAYLDHKPFVSDLTLHVDMTDTTRMLLSFDAVKNFIKVADFEVDFAGWFAMTEEAMEMDITYAAKESTFASLFSLVPGVFLEDMAGMKLDGKMTFDGYVKGNYTEETLPGFGLNLLVENGLFQYPDLPSAVSGIGIDLNVDCKDGVIDRTVVDLKKLVANMGGNPISARLRMAGLTVIALDADAKVKLNLSTLPKMIPMEGTELKGIIDLAVSATGIYNEATDELPVVSGGLKIADLVYKSPDLPQGLTIPAASMELSPKAFIISQFDGTVGGTDFALTGNVTNYMGYAFGEADPVLRGAMTLNSKVLDVNEWLTDEETAAAPETPQEDVPMEVVGVPKNIDFTFASKISEVKYSTWDMKNLVGTIVVRDERVTLAKGTGFDLFGGRVTASGFYDTKNIEKPEYDFQLGIASMQIQNAYKAFAPVQKYLPAAEKMAGAFSTDFKIGGLLGADMMPIYETLSGGGLIKLQNASVSDLKALSALSSVTNLDLKTVTLGNTAIKTQIVNGKLFVDQFPVKLGNVNSTVQGSTGIDGALDYLIGMDVPSGQVGQQLNSKLSSLGVPPAVGSTVHLDLKMGGTINDPKPTLLSNNAKQEAKNALEEKAKQEIEKAKEEVKQKVEEKKEEVKEEVTKEVEQKKEEVKEQGKEKAKEKIKGFGF